MRENYTDLSDELQVKTMDASHNKGNAKYSHPAFGLVQASRFTGGIGQYFGSDVKSHQSGISLTISSASVERGLSHDWFMEQGQLIEVRLTEVQWAGLITNMNTQGSPCTINYEHTRGRVTMPELPDKFETYKHEFSKRLDNANASTDQLIAMLKEMGEGKTIKKSDLKDALDKAFLIHQELGANLEFTKNSLHEEVDTIKMDAIKSIEGTIINKIHSMGIKAINNETIPTLIGSADDKRIDGN